MSDPRADDTGIAPKQFEGPFTKRKLRTLVAEFNRRYAVVNEGGHAVIFRRVRDRILNRFLWERINFADFKKLYLNRSVQVNEAECENAAEFWLTHKNRKQYLEGVVFDPTGKASAECLNLWAGFPIKPKRGDWSLMYAHIEKVICSGDYTHREYLLNWLARMFQHPDVHGEVAVVLRGLKGCGKGTLGNWLHNAWGQHGLHITSAKHLVGSFNGHLRDAVFLFADEAFAVADKQQEAVLKGLITEPIILIEAKYQNPVNVRNMPHILMSSNEAWVVPASIDERRYFVLDVAPTRIGNCAYFAALHAQMENGGVSAMIYDLQHRDISAFDPRAMPNTAALDEQKLLSLDSLHRWWREVLDRGYVSSPSSWLAFQATEHLHEAYRRWAEKDRTKDIQGREQLGRFMASMYQPTRPRAAVAGQPRLPGYILGDLKSARRAFELKTKLSFGWDDDAEAAE